MDLTLDAGSSGSGDSTKVVTAGPSGLLLHVMHDLYLSLCIYIYYSISMYIYTHLHTYLSIIYVYVHMSMYACLYVYIYTCISYSVANQSTKPGLLGILQGLLTPLNPARCCARH